MKQNNRRKTWKAVVAVVLMIVALFAVSTMVSAGFIETVFDEVYELMSTSSNTHKHTDDCYTDVTVIVKCERLEGLGDYSICTALVPKCSGGEHDVEEIWHQLTCGYNSENS